MEVLMPSLHGERRFVLILSVTEAIDPNESYLILYTKETVENMVNIPPNVQVIVPLAVVSEGLLATDRIWIYVDTPNDDNLWLRKIGVLNGNYILGIFDEVTLRPLLINYNEILFHNAKYADPTKKLLETMDRRYQFNEYIIDPLNPLSDDLDLGIYHQFNRDSFKYNQYAQSIELAINDLYVKYEDFKVLVIGPGLGNLVDSVYKYHRNITIVEKNPKLRDHLIEKNSTDWNNDVNIIFDDVRNIPTTEYKLVVSEMLGSFGCNELFPEVLHTVNAEVMIPTSILTFITPVYSKITHRVPFLNNMKTYYKLSQPIKVWDFFYPDNNSLDKSITVDVKAEFDGKINALKGNFHSTLYGNFEITNFKTRNYCKSWFPIVFPIHEISVKKGQIISIKFQRSSGSSLTYSWEVNGSSYTHSIPK